jgi:Rad3-related DNA helicase
MIINERGEPPSDVIELFRNSGPGTILVSPSVGTGYDFPQDDCRWQFMTKIPFEPPSKIVKAREADDPEYRSYQAMQALVQAFGRDMRSKTDWSERFIGDDHLEWFLPRYGHLAPRSFHAFFRRVSVVPQPPRL